MAPDKVGTSRAWYRNSDNQISVCTAIKDFSNLNCDIKLNARPMKHEIMKKDSVKKIKEALNNF